MARVAVICREALGSGFQLAGLEVRLASGGEDARTQVRELLAGSEHGLVLIEQDLLDELDERTQKAVDASNVPLIVPFPSLSAGQWERDEKAYIQEMVRRSIGFTIRIA